MKIEVVYSPDDNGFYAEVYDKKTGKTLYTTPVVKLERSAVNNAKRWILKNSGE